MVETKEDLTNKIFGRLLVLKRVEDKIRPNGRAIPQWLCECSCKEHTKKIVEHRALINGNCKSCGCIRKEIQEKQKSERLGKEKLNNQGCLMKIVEYDGYANIVVEFQDEYKIRINSTYDLFQVGSIKNPYYPSVFGVGITGNKYSPRINGGYTKEYRAWQNMLGRCFTKTYKTYDEVTCCKEWLLFDNFYEWLHSQPNFDKWYNNKKWAVDKDILVKGNKIYSPETCCLVPNNINILFLTRKKSRGNLPIGVHYKEETKKYMAYCSSGKRGTHDYLGLYESKEEAFLAYKNHKESKIKQVAEEEFFKGNITKKTYDAMMKYEVEITD